MGRAERAGRVSGEPDALLAELLDGLGRDEPDSRPTGQVDEGGRHELDAVDADQFGEIGPRKSAAGPHRHKNRIPPPERRNPALIRRQETAVDGSLAVESGEPPESRVQRGLRR